MFNAKNPFDPGLDESQQRRPFMQPTAFAGDVGQGEQRMAQLGVRFTLLRQRCRVQADPAYYEGTSGPKAPIYT